MNKSVALKICITIASCLIVFVTGCIVWVKLGQDNTPPDRTFEIETVIITLDDKPVGENIDKEFTADDFTFGVVINDGKLNIGKDAPIMTWRIIGNDLDCKINRGMGLFSIGDTLGSVTVQVEIMSKNKMTANVTVNITAPKTFYLNSIEAISPQSGLTFIEGQTFDATGLQVLAHFHNVEIAPNLTAFTYSAEPLSVNITEIELRYNHAGVERVTTVPIIIIPKTLQSIEVTNFPPLSYIEGQSFDSSDLEVTAHYEYMQEIIYDYTIINNVEVLTPSIKSLTIIYVATDVIKTVELPLIIVPRTLQTIQIESQPTKTKYVQGQTFKIDGLQVTARYEYMDLDVTNLIKYSTGKLYSNNEFITITYTENGVSKSEDISIEVFLPYEKVRKITFENPFDATLSWLYEYNDGNGEQNQIDNTELTGHDNLIFDIENGIYVAPIGAIITILKINPVITDFVFDGVTQNLQYPANSMDFELNLGEDMEITFNKILGERITVRFASVPNQNNWAFIYPSNYNAAMRSGDLAQIAQIYEDTTTYFYQYAIGEDTYNFAELAGLNIIADTLITAVKIEREATQTVTVNVIYVNDVSMKVTLDKTDKFAFVGLPRVNRIGYSLGFSNEIGGVLFNETTFAGWLGTAENNDEIYAIYALNASIVEGNILGAWAVEIIDEQNMILNLVIVFNADGTYIYTMSIDNEINCEFMGIYEFNDGKVEILSCESGMPYQLVSPGDFEINLDDDTLTATLFIVRGLQVESGAVVLNKNS
jgi:hypothetical protein